MSHTTTIKAIKIASISALEAAVKDLNEAGIICTLERDTSPRAYFVGQQGLGKAPYVLKLSQSKYDIGFYLSDDGKTYEARTDFWDRQVENLLGAQPGAPERAGQAKMGKLFQYYGAAAAMEAARKKGQMVRKTVKPSGEIVLDITGFN